MGKFSELSYQRPDVKELKKSFAKHLQNTIHRWFIILDSNNSNADAVWHPRCCCFFISWK